MRVFSKPTILLSSCIEHEACRYDGSMTRCPFVRQLMPFVNYITVCPEVSIGLSTPREALRIVSNTSAEEDRLVFSKSGEDITNQMNAFSDAFIEELLRGELHGIILKGRSPSCGIKEVKMYTGVGKSAALPKKTTGIFARKVMENFSGIAVEDEGRLLNYSIREHFFTRIFTLADFHAVKARQSIKELIRFHSENKYLLMAYSPSGLKKLGRLIGSYEKVNVNELLSEYEKQLTRALTSMTGTMRNLNMLLHLFGYFSKEVSEQEKAFFLDTLESYGNKKVPFSVPLALIHAWAVRFENKYLENQTLFEAFPKDLIEVTDSGKGI